MNRVARSRQRTMELFGNAEHAYVPDSPEFIEIRDRFMYGEVYEHGNLSTSERLLISIVSLSTIQELQEIPAYTRAGIRAGIKPETIQEAIYQCTPYIGFPRTQTVLEIVLKVFRESSIPLPLASQKTVQESNRLDKGLEVQKAIFGDVIDTMRSTAPADLKHIQDYLSSFCFGDIYTRLGLDLRTRELLTFCILISLGGCESQVHSHISGNIQVGNTRETLISAVTQCLPLIGFPRTLQALKSLTEVFGENTMKTQT